MKKLRSTTKAGGTTAANAGQPLGISRQTAIDSLPEFLRVEEYAALMDISRGTAYELCRTGSVQALRLGRLLRIPREAVKA